MLEQAKRYASGLPDTIGRWNNFTVPFLYSSNGTSIWFADVRDEQYYSRELIAFHTPEGMEEMFAQNNQSFAAWLRKNPKEIKGLRP